MSFWCVWCLTRVCMILGVVQGSHLWQHTPDRTHHVVSKWGQHRASDVIVGGASRRQVSRQLGRWAHGWVGRMVCGSQAVLSMPVFFRRHVCPHSLVFCSNSFLQFADPPSRPQASQHHGPLISLPVLQLTMICIGSPLRIGATGATLLL